jgi:glutaredoxin
MSKLPRVLGLGLIRSTSPGHDDTIASGYQTNAILTTVGRPGATVRVWQWVTGLWRREQTLGHLQVVLYTRDGCHLCEDALKALDASRQRHGFRLSIVDVDSDPQLARKYGEQVPVVTVGGKVRFHGQVNGVLLERLLARERSMG